MPRKEQNPYESPRSIPEAAEHRELQSKFDLESGDGIVSVASYKYVSEAHLVQGLLAQHGIDSRLDNEGVAGNYALWSNAVGGIKVVVRKSEAERVIQLLEKHQEAMVVAKSDEAIEFDCEECGALLRFPGNRRGCVETCPKCEEYIDVPD